MTEESEPAAAEQEPDYRFTLANERTFLAWIRTALALIAGGVAVVQFVPQFGVAGVRHALSVVLTAGGGADAQAVAQTFDHPPSSPFVVAETSLLIHVPLRGPQLAWGPLR